MTSMEAGEWENKEKSVRFSAAKAREPGSGGPPWVVTKNDQAAGRGLKGGIDNAGGGGRTLRLKTGKKDKR